MESKQWNLLHTAYDKTNNNSDNNFYSADFGLGTWRFKEPIVWLTKEDYEAHEEKVTMMIIRR